MSINDRKVVQLSVEPDVSDAQVMIGLREAIKFSKENKCKSLFIVMVPEEDSQGMIQCFIRTYSRGNLGDAVQLVGVLENAVNVFKDYLISVFNKHK